MDDFGDMIEISSAITSHNRFLCCEIFHPKTKVIKLNRDITISGEVTYGNQVLYEFGGNEDVVKVQRGSIGG